MYRHAFLTATLLLVTVCGVTAPLGAQTGPTGPEEGQPGQMNPPVGARLNPESVSAYLCAKGYKVELKKIATMTTLYATVRKDGWAYRVEVEFPANGKIINFVSPLTQPAGLFSSTQLLALLRWNYDNSLASNHFSFRQADQRLCFEDINFGTQMTEAQLGNALNSFLRKIQSTYPLWDTKRWPEGNGSLAVPQGGGQVIDPMP